MNRIIIRSFSISSKRFLKKITEKTEGHVITISLEEVKENPNASYLKTASDQGCSICNCKLPMKLKYSDVLILEQFMREDGTVLPKELTGICTEHQEIVERCVMQAHWSGLFPDKTTADFVRSGYKRFNRWWKDDTVMFTPELKRSEGKWFYIKRYNPKIDELNRPINYNKSPRDGHGQWEYQQHPARPVPPPLPFASSLHGRKFSK